MTNLQNNMNSVVTSSNARVGQINHFETGQVSCGSQDTWTANNAQGTRDLSKAVTFSRAFPSAPYVVVSVVYLNADARNNRAVRYYAFPKMISTTGFQVSCRDYSNSV